MHLATVFTILSLGLFFCIMGTEGTRCNTACTREYNPICGSLKRRDGKSLQCTFGNPCLLRVRRCLTNEQWVGKSGRCAVNSPKCDRIRRN